MSIQNVDFMVDKSDLTRVQFERNSIADIAPGQALLKVDSFSFTANNITYALLGDAFSYWDFFPAPEGFGRIPVWGFADVLSSKVEGVGEGDRLYGYLPMSTHLLVEPGHVNDHGFMDIVSHRAARSPIYNQYTFTAKDPVYSPENEGLISLFRPLFTTSFLLDVFHAKSDFFGANCILLTSASSKTAIGLASLLAKRDLEVIGLTSASNRDFVVSLAYYDRVISYEELETLPVVPSAFVDMAGSGDVLARVHRHFGDALKKSLLVGATHWDERNDVSKKEMPGAVPEVFFAPGFAQTCIQDMGRERFLTNIGRAWADFIPHTSNWIRVEKSSGSDQVEAVYRNVLNNVSNPSTGQILSLWEGARA
ncbi:MAG: hypothetical protein CSB48_09580 [Proteobacteria bacterium]|nr:MAG: hypothetical protein CSB48_09580 [Pseudomonadota bacterium]PIE40471.1 MAG: hypothetical protein CSA51_00540 [Gammaproteobacteria bacterium]